MLTSILVGLFRGRDVELHCWEGIIASVTNWGEGGGLCLQLQCFRYFFRATLEGSDGRRSNGLWIEVRTKLSEDDTQHT